MELVIIWYAPAGQIVRIAMHRNFVQKDLFRNQDVVLSRKEMTSKDFRVDPAVDPAVDPLSLLGAEQVPVFSPLWMTRLFNRASG